jgi:uncharacterized delta-60 repeat protein
MIAAGAAYLILPGRHAEGRLLRSPLTAMYPAAVKANNSNAIAAQSPGVISFAAQSFDANEGFGTRHINLSRLSGTDNQVVAKVTLADITTTSADYRLVPGAPDDTFLGMSVDGYVHSLALQADGKVIVGGSFTTSNGVRRNCIARLYADGSLDLSFNPGTGLTYNGLTSSPTGIFARAKRILVQGDGKIIIAGQFSHYNGIQRNNIARLNPDGSLDTSFDPGTGADSPLMDAVLQPDGKIIIGGNQLTNYNGTARNRIARLNADGSLDLTFNAGVVVEGTVGSLALQADGLILVGGFFNISTSPSVKNVARFSPDGSLDTTFNSGAAGINNYVATMAVQPDGRVLVGGYFSNRSGASRSHIARLNSDGSLDTEFNSHANGFVEAIVVQPDGKIVIAGGFDLYNNTWRGRIARLNPDSSVDWTFNTLFSADNHVLALAMQPDGRIILGGYFSIYEGVSRMRLARVTNDLFVTWPAGDSSDKVVKIPIVDDTLDEGSESLTLTLTLLSGGATIGAHPTTTLTITDNDLTISSVSGIGAFGDTATLTAKLTSAGIALSGKSVRFSLNGNALGTATTDSNGLATLTGVSLSGINAGTYTNAVGVSFAGDTKFSSKSQTGTLIVNKAVATIALSNLSHTYDGTAKVPIATTTPAGKSVVFSYSRSGSTFSSAINAGSYTVSANINDTNYQGNAVGTLIIDKAQASITLGSLSQTYDGRVKRATATTNPSGLTGIFIGYSQNGVTVTSAINAGNYNVVASLNNNNYQANDATGIFVINKATPAITWSTPSDVVFGVPLSSTQLNASANVPGDFQYTPPTGTVLAVGTHQLSATFMPADAVNFNSVTKSVPLVVVRPPLQLILEESETEPNQNPAAAIDATSFLRDPFPVIEGGNLLNPETDKNTRVIVFVANLELAQNEPPSSVIVHLTDAHGTNHEAAAEDVQLVPLFNFTQVRFRLPDNLSPGTCTIKVRAHGQETNSGTIRIRN